MTLSTLEVVIHPLSASMENSITNLAPYFHEIENILYMHSSIYMTPTQPLTIECTATLVSTHTRCNIYETLSSETTAGPQHSRMVLKSLNKQDVETSPSNSL